MKAKREYHAEYQHTKYVVDVSVTQGGVEHWYDVTFIADFGVPNGYQAVVEPPDDVPGLRKSCYEGELPAFLLDSMRRSWYRDKAVEMVKKYIKGHGGHGL